ncbi:MAG: GNAT family N-acetyltransferase [Erysipelotrichaceae bacterium]|nr:GNAT family N-acetyltransferase [Erysipelotrichaceae bacterium]
MKFEPSKEMKIILLPEQEEQLCTKETIKEVFAKDDKGECMAFDIYGNEEMVGFAMFCEYPKGSFFLWNYGIDVKYQNQGIGTRALEELLAYMISNYDVKEFTTTYLWGNEHAKRLYEKVGFVETDVIDEEDCHEVNMLYRVE